MIYTHAIAAILGAAIAAGGAWQVQNWRYGNTINAMKAEAAQKEADEQAQARKREQELNARNRKVTNELAQEKARRAADAAVVSGKLRDLESAISADTATTSGGDDPRDRIIGECARALVELDGYAKGVAATARALQGYAREVCVGG